MERSDEFDEVESTRSDADHQARRARVILDVQQTATRAAEFSMPGSKIIESAVLRTDAIG